MTNLTSEQYRDVIQNVKNCTEELPSVQNLLRKAVKTFFDRFGGYPEMGGVAPGKVGIFGEQTQFDGGLALPAAIPMAAIVVGRRAPGPRFTVATSADVGKPHKVKFSFSRKRPLAPGCPEWLNHVKGVIDNYPEAVPPFEAAIESSVPMGVGFGSSSAVETAAYTFIEVLVGKKSDPVEKAKACQKTERDFAGKEVGLVDRIAAVLAKDRHVMTIDCKTNETQWIPLYNRDLTFVAVDSHEKDVLLGDEYSERSKYIAKACEMLGVESLRDCTEDSLSALENKVNNILNDKHIKEEEAKKANGGEGGGGGEEEGEEEDEEKETKSSETRGDVEKVEGGNDTWSEEEYNTMIRRAKFFITEMKRISDAIEALNTGDFESFGEYMKESHNSLNEDFGFRNPLLDFLVETSLQVEGVLGSKMTGMGLGFGGGILTLVKKENVEKYCNYVTEKFAENRSNVQNEVTEQRQRDKERWYEVKRRAHSEHYNPAIASSEIIGKIQSYLEEGGSPKRLSLDVNRTNLEKKETACIVKVERPESSCGTWGRYEKNKQKEDFLRRKAIEKEEAQRRKTNESFAKGRSAKDGIAKGGTAKGGTAKGGTAKGSSAKEGYAKDSLTREGSTNDSSATSSQVSQVEPPSLKNPTFYIVSPFAGARMLFVTKTDILRSPRARPVPHPKSLIRSALAEFKTEFDLKPEAVGVAPATLTLFGEFMEFHLGYIICMALPMVTVTVGGRNDSVYFSFKTTSKDVKEPNVMKNPLPCVQAFKIESRNWVNFVSGCVSEFKGHVPGFSAVIDTSIPLEVGLNSCSALQVSVYTFLESLTRCVTSDLFEKAEMCSRNEYEFRPVTSELVTPCSSIKFLPTLICKEGNLMLINCKRYKISQYFFDHPSYVFLIATCRNNTTNVTVKSLDERLRLCIEALEILGRNSLLNADLKHLRCLKKRDATEETISRVKYVITEHQRTIEAVKAIKDEDYERVGLLMNQSHVSLRDDYQVSSPEIEALVSLALSVEGVLGAKMVGRGLKATVVILLKITDVDRCIQYMRKKYEPKSDRPVFYVTKPSAGAYAMDLNSEVPLIP